MSATAAEKLRSKHVRTLEVLQKLVDENKALKEQLQVSNGGSGGGGGGGGGGIGSDGDGASSSGELASLRAEVERLKKALGDAQAEESAGTDQIVDLSSQLRVARDEVDKLRSQLKGRDSTESSKVKQLEHDICELRSSNLELMDELKDLRKKERKTQEEQGENPTSQGSDAAAKDAAAAAAAAAAAGAAATVDLEARVEHLRGECRKLEQQLAQRDAALQAAAADTERREAAEAAFKEELSRAWSECEEARDRAARAAKEAAGLKHGMKLASAGSSSQITELERRLAAMEQALTEAQAEAARAAQELERARTAPAMPQQQQQPPAAPATVAPAVQQAPPPSFSAHVHQQLKSENQVLRSQIEDLMQQQRRLLKGMSRATIGGSSSGGSGGGGNGMGPGPIFADGGGGAGRGGGGGGIALTSRGGIAIGRGQKPLSIRRSGSTGGLGRRR